MGSTTIWVPYETAQEFGWGEDTAEGATLTPPADGIEIPDVYGMGPDCDPVKIVYESSMPHLGHVELRISGPGLAKPWACSRVEAIFGCKAPDLISRRRRVLGPRARNGGRVVGRNHPTQLTSRVHEMTYETLMADLLLFAAHDRSAAKVQLDPVRFRGTGKYMLPGLCGFKGRRGTLWLTGQLDDVKARHPSWETMPDREQSQAIVDHFITVRLPGWEEGLTDQQLCLLAGIMESDMTISHRGGKLILEFVNTDLAFVLLFRSIVLVDEQDMIAVYEKDSNQGLDLTIFHDAIAYIHRCALYGVDLNIEEQNL